MSATQSDRVSQFLNGNWLFDVVLALLILVPATVDFFGPPILTELSDLNWLGIAAGTSIVLLFVADEVFIRGGRNMSTGFTQKGTIANRLLTNPMFIVAVLVLVFGPPLATYYGPVVFASLPDWPWLLVAWAVGAGAAWTAYRVLLAEEARGAASPA